MKAYKITHLSIAFVLVVSLLASVLLFLIFQNLNDLSEKQNSFQRDEARKELDVALIQINNYLEKVRGSISDWGETKQQFVNNEFYQIWKESRVPDSGILPKEIDDIALYDIDGKAFPARSKVNLVPETIVKGSGYFQKKILNNKEYWLYVFPVFGVDFTERNSVENVLGYAVLAFSIEKMISGLADFKFVDVSTIKTTYNNDARFTFYNAINDISYKLKDDIYRKELEYTTSNALIEIVIFIVFWMLLAILSIHRFLVRPLKNISMEIGRLYNEKNLLSLSGQALPAQPIYELENVRRSFNDYQSKFISLNKDLEANNKEFFKIAHEDSLTRAYNRRAFEDDWAEYNKTNHNELYAILIFDCDNFKPINDSYGHAVGDAVIRNIATVLKESIGSINKLYRLGGDEFSTILKKTTEKEVLALADLCRKNVLEYDFRKYGLSESISVSVGISFSTVAKKTFTEIMKQADLAMYKAKRPGESSIVIYSSDLSTVESIASTKAVNAVFAAIKHRDKIKMRYQPVVTLPALELSYVEALVKVDHDNQIYMPKDIFPIVEGRNLDVEFDLSVIAAIENDINAGRFSAGQGISLNLSAPSVINSRIIDLLIKIKIAHPKIKLIIEITETALITQIEKASKNINQLRNSGYLIALDDFGSGYSSLRYLTSMPVDIIKFDITMIHLLENEDKEHRNMIEKLSELIIDLGYDVVAEGIETQSMLDKVISLGFSYSQGYFTGRPEEL